ncbi:hypothetical protein Tco_0339482 [Tanacetum coccineum]
MLSSDATFSMEMFPFGYCPKENGDVSSMSFVRENNNKKKKKKKKFSMTQDIRTRAAVHIFNRISFAIAKGVGAQIVSWLPSNLL